MRVRTVSSITVTQQIQDLIDLVYPDLTPRERGNKVRDDIHKLYLERLSVKFRNGETDRIPEQFIEVSPEIPFVVQQDPRAIADRIATMAPEIDDINWMLIKNNVESMLDADMIWDNPAELRLIAKLNEPFDGATSKRRVQNSRIRAFFARLI